MLHLLFVSEDGSGVEIAQKCAQEGNKISFYIPKLTDNLSYLLKSFKNPRLVKKITNDLLDTVDIAIFTTVHNGDLADWMKERNILVFGGGSIHDKLELDRAFGSKFTKFTSVDTPNTVEFKTVDEGLEYIQSKKQGVAIKANGNASTTLSLVSTDFDYMKSVLKVHGKDYEKDGFIVQDRVEGVEVSTEGWFNGERFVNGMFNHTIEKKRMGYGDIGENGGCYGNIVWPAHRDEKLVQTIFGNLEEPLTKLGYCGMLDMNCIVNEDKAYFLEWSSRFGYDAFQALAGMFTSTITEAFWHMVMKKPEPLMLKKGYNMAVRLTLLPHPLYAPDHAKKLRGIKVLNMNKGASKHTWLADVMLNDEGLPVLAGVDGNIGCVVAGGDSIPMAEERVYRTIDNIVATPDVYYRRDIADGVEEKIKTLRKWGWLNA